MVPFVIPFVPMVMAEVPLALPVVPLEEPRTEPIFATVGVVELYLLVRGSWYDLIG